MGCFTDETIAVGIFNAPPTLHPPLPLLDYSFFTVRSLTQALQRTEQNLVWWSPGYIEQLKAEVVTADSHYSGVDAIIASPFIKETGQGSVETSWTLSLMLPIWQGQTLGFCRTPTDSLD